MTNYEDRVEIKTFREYLQIPSVHPDIDYGNFLITLKYTKFDLLFTQ